MARTFRAGLALSALALSAFAGVAVAGPNSNAGPPPSASDPCLDIVGGLGQYVVDPVASVPVPPVDPAGYPGGNVVVATGGTLTFEMDLAAPSCTKGHYTLNIFSEPTTTPLGTELVPSQQVATASQLGTGETAVNDQNQTVYPVRFSVAVSDLTTSLRDTSNPCVLVQGTTSARGETPDVAPDTGLLTVCTTSPGTAGFN